MGMVTVLGMGMEGCDELLCLSTGVDEIGVTELSAAFWRVQSSMELKGSMVF